MKTFKDFLNETQELAVTKEELESRVMATWKKVFPNSHITVFKTSLGRNDTTSLFTCYLFQNSSQWLHGISENDPLHLSFSIKQSPAGFVVDYSSNSYSVAPDQKHMAYGRHKIPLRKTTVKDGPFAFGNFLQKMDGAFQTVRSEGIKALKAGKFSVYDETQQSLIAQRLK